MERNKDLVRRLFTEAFNERKLAVCDEIVAHTYIEHAVAPFGREAPGTVSGPDHMREVVTWLVDQFPDVTMKIESVIAEGDAVAVRVMSEGTNLGRLNGVIPPTGQRFSAQQAHWYRIEDNKLAEHWAVRDDLASMLQLGVIRPPGPPS